MSTTYESILILGCPAEFKKVERIEKRFHEKTGEPYDKTFFDHFDLVVGDKILWSGDEKWEAQEHFENGIPFQVFETCNDQVFVGWKLGHMDEIGHQEIPKLLDAGIMALHQNDLQSRFGTAPKFILIQDVS